MKDSATIWLIVIISIAVTVFGFHMNSVKERNFDNIPYSYPEIAIDVTKCNERLKGERK